MMNSLLKLFTITTMIVFMSSCASMNPNFEKPKIAVVSISPSANASDGFNQSFNIGLKVMNPNSSELSLVGMSYQIEIDGFDVLSGVANEIPTIAGYSEERVDVTASISLLEGLRFINSLLSSTSSNIDYKVSAKLDTGIPLFGNVPVVNSGKIDLSDIVGASK